jgi:hypothetical protein
MWTIAWVVWCGVVMAADEAETSDEILVYADDFARWDNTRWHVLSEVIVPLPLTFGANENSDFFSYAAQTRMVLLCQKDGEASTKRVEALCEIEDIGILATSVRNFAKERDRERVQRVLDEIDATLTGAKLQLQVDVKGGVNNVDIEGLTARNERERTNHESLRQLLLRALAGFHLRIPDHAQREGQWYEYGSTLMMLPSMAASRGSSTMVHTVSLHRGEGYAYQLVQTMGHGVSQVNLPNVDLSRPATTTPPKVSSATERVEIVEVVGNESSVELTYALDVTAVAVFERETGVMTERVWATRGSPTASSGSGTLNNPFRNVGKLRLLGADERPDVGPTGQVSWPMQTMEGLHPWVDLDVMPN